MKLTTYLNFPGNCSEALDFYAKHLGAKILMKSNIRRDGQLGGPQDLPPGLSRKAFCTRAFRSATRW